LIRDNKVQIATKASAKQQFNVTTSSKKLYVATLLIKEGTNDTWYVDIDANHHMSHDLKSFVTYEKCDHGKMVFLGDNTTHSIHDCGKVSIRLTNDYIKEISNVLHVPFLKKKLFFTKQLDQARGGILIKNGQCFKK